MKTISIIGLGYVGLPLAVAFAKKYKVIGFDINQKRIDELNKGIDSTLEISEEEQKKLNLKEDSNYFVLNIVILNEPFLDSTVNFAAPLIFNSDKKILGQVVLDEYNFGLMEPLKKFVKGNR